MQGFHQNVSDSTAAPEDDSTRELPINEYLELFTAKDDIAVAKENGSADAIEAYCLIIEKILYHQPYMEKKYGDWVKNESTEFSADDLDIIQSIRLAQATKKDKEQASSVAQTQSLPQDKVQLLKNELLDKINDYCSSWGLRDHRSRVAKYAEIIKSGVTLRAIYNFFFSQLNSLNPPAPVVAAQPVSPVKTDQPIVVNSPSANDDNILTRKPGESYVARTLRFFGCTDDLPEFLVDCMNVFAKDQYKDLPEVQEILSAYKSVNTLKPQ